MNIQFRVAQLNTSTYNFIFMSFFSDCNKIFSRLPNRKVLPAKSSKDPIFPSCIQNKIHLIDSTMLKWWHTRIVPHRTQLRRFVQPISLSLFHLWPRKVHSCGKWILSTRLNRHVIFCWWCTLSAQPSYAVVVHTLHSYVALAKTCISHSS